MSSGTTTMEMGGKVVGGCVVGATVVGVIVVGGIVGVIVGCSVG